MHWIFDALLIGIILFLALRLRQLRQERRALLHDWRHDSKREEARSRAQAEELSWHRVLGEQLPLPTIVTDREKRMLYANRAARELFGEVEIGEGTIVRLRNNLLEQWLDEGLRRGELEPQALELRARHYIVQATAWSAPEDGRPAGMVMTLQDVTQLVQLTRARRDMASNLSHELRTPLTSVRLMTETLLNGSAEQPELARKLVTRIAAETEAMIRLIEDMTALSGIESGRTPLRLEAVDLRQLVQMRLERLAPQQELKRLRLSLESVDSPLVSLDPERFGQVLTNLLDNAIKFSPEEGTIHLTIERDNDHTLLQVRDEGPGIPPVDLPRIFERFYKGDRARTRTRVAGTGLGLAIAKHLVEAHGGMLEVSNHPKRGAIFTIRLPNR